MLYVVFATFAYQTKDVVAELAAEFFLSFPGHRRSILLNILHLTYQAAILVKVEFGLARLGVQGEQIRRGLGLPQSLQHLARVEPHRVLQRYVLIAELVLCVGLRPHVIVKRGAARVLLRDR